MNPFINIFSRKKKSVGGAPLPPGWSKTWLREIAGKVKSKYPYVVIDENCPEYDAQKIYQHWIKSFL